MLHYRIHEHSPDADWVVLLHGAGGASSTWLKQVRPFSKVYNVILIDLRGHGRSKLPWNPSKLKNYTFDLLAEDVVEVLDELEIKSFHLVGISLGCIINRQIAEHHPNRVKSMILGGAVLKVNVRFRFLLWLGNLTKNMLPYMFLYRFFAWAIMPKKNHRESRIMFVREAKKLQQREFRRWFKLTASLKSVLSLFRDRDLGIPTLYLMGEEDHLFLPAAKQATAAHESAQLVVFPDCGHVVNVEQPERFNEESLSFLKSLS